MVRLVGVRRGRSGKNRKKRTKGSAAQDDFALCSRPLSALWRAGGSGRFSVEIDPSHVVAQIFQVARAEADVVADEEGGGSESRHDFGT